MRSTLVKRFRPQRVKVGPGRSTYALGDGTIIFGEVKFHSDSVLLEVDSQEDIQIGDYIEVVEGNPAG